MTKFQPWRKDQVGRPSAPQSLGGGDPDWADPQWDDIDRSIAKASAGAGGRPGRRKTGRERERARKGFSNLIAIVDPGGLTSVAIERLHDRYDRGRAAREAAAWSGGAPSFESQRDSSPSSDGWGDVGSVAPRAPRRSAAVGRRLPFRIVAVSVGAVATAALAVVLVVPRVGGAGDDPVDAAAPEAPVAPAPDAGSAVTEDGASSVPEAPPPVSEVPDSPADQAPAAEPPAAVPPPVPAGADEIDLFDPPPDRAAFIARVRADTVSILCYRGSAQGSGWPLDFASLGVQEETSGTLIITNGHVTEGCSQVTVRHGDRQYDGNVVGTDFIDSGLENDFAVVRVSQAIRGFPVATSFAVGQWVLAAGSPSGVEQTVTSGIVSNDIDGVIWTDTTISPGSSGGPLINSRGEVIGVVTWGLIGDSGVDPDLGMAIPVRRLCDRLFTCGAPTG